MSHLIETNLLHWNVVDAKSLIQLTKNSYVSEKIKVMNHGFCFSNAVSQLSQIGSLLKLAYAGSKGSRASELVITILCDYQTLVKKTQTASSAFIRASIYTLQNCQAALLLLKENQDDNLQSALEVMVDCSTTAGKMAKLAGQLFEKSQELFGLAKETLIATTKEGTNASTQKDLLEQKQASLMAHQKGLESRATKLSREIPEIERDAAMAHRAVENRRRRQFFSSFINPILMGSLGPEAARAACKGISNCFHEDKKKRGDADKYQREFESQQEIIGDLKSAIREKEDVVLSLEECFAEKQVALSQAKDRGSAQVVKISQELSSIEDQMKKGKMEVEQLQEKMKKYQNAINRQGDISFEVALQADADAEHIKKEIRQTNGKIAATIHRLKALKDQRHSLERSVVALDVATQTLGKIATVFNNVRQFWETVEDEYGLLEEGKRKFELFAKKEKFLPQFIKNIEKIQWRWLSLGKMNCDADDVIVSLNKDIDGIMNNLPSEKECTVIIEKTSDTILELLAFDETRMPLLVLSSSETKVEEI